MGGDRWGLGGTGHVSHIDTCVIVWYRLFVIKTIRHKGLKQFWTKGQTKGLVQNHVPRITRMMDVLDAAHSVADLDLPGFYLHPLKGEGQGRYSIRVSGNWRLTFEFIEGDVYVLDYEDYH